MPTLAETVVADLRAIFALRLNAVVVYGRHAVRPAPNAPLHTLARVTELSMADLEACARRARTWQKNGIAVPLLVARDEFSRALDVFPLEFGAILAGYRVVYGPDPFEGLSVQAGASGSAGHEHDGHDHEHGDHGPEEAKPADAGASRS